MSYTLKLILFFALNFGALAIGSYFTSSGVTSTWYQTANQAPWTPPGFVFGIAWTGIMICFSFFMANIISAPQIISLKTIYILFAVQWLLNVLWNPIFFKYHLTGVALCEIISLLIVVGCFMYVGVKNSRINLLLIAPYFVWLIIAISLNAYIVFKN